MSCGLKLKSNLRGLGPWKPPQFLVLLDLTPLDLRARQWAYPHPVFGFPKGRKRGMIRRQGRRRKRRVFGFGWLLCRWRRFFLFGFIILCLGEASWWIDEILLGPNEVSLKLPCSVLASFPFWKKKGEFCHLFEFFFWDATSERMTLGHQRGETNVVKPSPSHRVRKLRKEKKEDDLDDFGFQLFWVTSRQFLCDVADNISSTYAGVEIKVDSQIMMKRLEDICENLLLVSFVQHESMQVFNSCCCYQTLSETDGCLTFVPCDDGLSMYIARPRLRWTGQASPRIEILLRPKKG